TETASARSALLGWAGQALDRVAGGPRVRSARNRGAVAAASLPRALDQAFRWASRGPPARRCIDQGSVLTNGCGESPVGRPPNPWRSADAGDRGGRADGLPAPPEAAFPAVADLADVPRQPRPRPGGAGFLHGAHGGLAGALRPRRARSPAPA